MGKARRLDRRERPDQPRSTVVGRDALVGQLCAAIDAIAVSPPLLVVEGPAGIGKTAVVDVLADHGLDAGVVVWRGGAHETDATLPFSSLATVLGLSARSDDPARAHIGSLLAASQGQPVEPAQRRWEVTEAVLDLLHHQTADTPVLLVVDDLHWADEDSAAALVRIERLRDERPLGIVLTSRPGPRPAAVDAVLRSLDGRGAQTTNLAPLGAEDVNLIATQLLGAPPDHALVGALGRAAGNPLYVRELLQALLDDDAVAVGAEVATLVADVLPTSLRRTLVRRLGVLPEETLEVLRTTSVLGTSAPLDRVCTVLRQPPAVLAGLLRPAYQAELLAADEDAVTFRHALIRDALYDDLPRTARAALHTAAARALLEDGAPQGVVGPHLALAVQGGARDLAPALVSAAGALVETAPTVARAYAELAVRVLPPDATDRLGGQVVAARAAARTGDPASAERLAVHLDDPTVDVALRLDLWQTVTLARHFRGEYADAPVARYETLVRKADLDAEERARHLALIAVVLRWHEPVVAMGLAKEVLATASRADSRVMATTAIALAGLLDTDFSAAMAASRDAWVLATSTGLAESWVGIEAARVFAFVHTLDPAEADAARTALEQALAAAERAGMAHALPGLHRELAGDAHVRVEFDRAVGHARAALRISEATGYRQDEPVARRLLAAIAWARGQDEVVAEQHAALGGLVLEDTESSPVSDLLAQAEHLLWAGEVDEAWRWADRYASRLLGGDRRFVIFNAIYSVPYVEVALAADQRRAAEDFTGLLQDLEVGAGGHPLLAVVAAQSRALVDGTAASARAAIALLDGAVAEMQMMGLRRMAGVLKAAGATREAVTALRRGRAIAERGNATRIIARYSADLRALGVGTTRRRGSGGRAQTGWEALTDAEWRVIDLVTQDLPYREVADRLFVSRRTVETHVANVFRKLDINSRQDLTRAVVDHQRG